MNRKIRTTRFLAVIAATLWALGAAPALATATAMADDAPGRTMAQQATKALPPWNTTDHSKHDALKQEFKNGQDITNACLSCHSEAANQFHQTIHWTWQASADGEEAKYGKAAQSLNNFCISANMNQDQSCLSCHPGWGTSMDSGINCLKCHSRKKVKWDEAVEDLAAFSADGDPESLEIAAEIRAELQAAAQDIGRPQRDNCGSCHFTGGGGDGVKHGDLDTSLIKPSKALDVHMGVDGQNFDCTRCHTTTQHNIAGRVYTRPAATDRKSLIEDDLTAKITCESCHSATPHEPGSKANDHTDRVACQTCHIPEMARELPTKMTWDWSAAGELKDGKPFYTKDEFGKKDYMSIKGRFTWAKNIQPEYFWYNGTIKSVTAKDMIDPGQTVALSSPAGGPQDPNSRIAPFKVHRARQPYDKVHKTLLVPILSTEEDGYWRHLDWQRALTAGQAANGLPYSGEFDFVDTTYVFPTTHMVAPKEKTLACNECHTRDDGRLQNVAGVYMPGRDRAGLLDSLGWVAVAASLFGVFCHGIGRVVTNGKREES
ncbi:MAG: tetrathionate reductase family octaheme c-type cytochrome [Desulfobacterales bacterium]|nr:tetrathionate reductase family octaheme c-type cytochrome [Desulfobacterales bacterium]MDJ0856124.1 tetrathionate reductase family octaheme c-type cytochrome [Desulfobacterales bacterium]MDJ0888351.1 tetrathionate reductase family octaheme c-type cytochrome [Desulfobacterales bacterium]MDJ0991041.1 tetrathionate reductase family octaheme c-type cytochrome [Desulfobacterales bacterium]